jgi:ferredoxin--NADP+ reductase
MSGTGRRRIELRPAAVISNTEIVHGVYVMEIEKHSDFVPGQLIAAARHPDDEPLLYSIACGKDHPTLRILYDVKPDGVLTPAMAVMKSGDVLYISSPFGRFTRTPENSWWIATGTGIAPFVSMTESGESANRTLLHGARYRDNFFFQDLFIERMEGRYLRFCTGEQGPGLIEGRITSYLKESNDIRPEIKYYLCGSADMVVEVRDILLQRGVPFDNIIAEIYF